MKDRPLITFALLTYNQAPYAREAARGAFAQRYSPIEIIFSDDASEDGTAEILKQSIADYKGKHSVRLNENSLNLGVGAHVNKVMALAQGEIVVVAAGDDISDCDRVECLVERFLSSPDIFSVWSSARYINSHGAPVARKFPRPKRIPTDLAMVRNIDPVIGATHAWRRQVFSVFGPLLPGVMFEDNAISFRSYLLGEIDFVDRDLVSYRIHQDNLTNFKRTDDVGRLYDGAAKRAAAALIGVAQREADLELAVRTRLPKPRNTKLMRKELSRLSHKLSWRLAAYRQYPSLPLDVLVRSLCDVEIAKVALRCLKHAIRSGFRGSGGMRA